MDILIKSFNRPYYLDRCLWSILQFVKNYEKILVMDDGTPQKYLSKIKAKYPFIEIIYSDDYQKKQSSIIENEPIISKKIPVKLWNDCAKKSTDYFIVIEDDMWFTESINLIEIAFFLKSNQLELLKLFWLGNHKLIDYKTITNQENIQICEPKSFVFNENYFYWIYFRLQKLNRYKKWLGLYKKDQFLDYYSIYGVAGMVFHKPYYLTLWSTNQDEVHEGKQLLQAIKYLKNKTKFSIAKTTHEVLRTGFISAATTNDKTHYKNNLNMMMFNATLNNFWYDDDFDSLENFPNDFSVVYLQGILVKKKIDYFEKWLNWHNEFKSQYIKLGCNI